VVLPLPLPLGVHHSNSKVHFFLVKGKRSLLSEFAQNFYSPSISFDFLRTPLSVSSIVFWKKTYA